jgi:outer membrane protein TolC
MKKLLTFLLLLVPFVANAQLTLEQCQLKAREHYPEVAQYDLIAQSEQYSISNASRSWIPQIVFSGQATWQSAVASFPDKLKEMLEVQGLDMPGIPQDQYKIALDVNQAIWDGGTSRANRKLARAEAAEQRFSSDVSIYSLEERINSIFFGILLLDENYATAQSRQELLNANYARLESMHRNGVALQSDLDLIKVEQLTLEQQIAQSRASRANFVTMLEMFIGETLGDRKLVKPREVIVSVLQNNRPEIGLIDAKIAGIDAKQGLLNTSLIPKFYFFAQGYYGNPGLDMFKSMTTREWSWNAILGVRMQWNISAFFTRGTDLKRLENARSALNVQRDVFTFNSSLQTSRQNGEIARMRKALEGDDQIVELRTNIRCTAESQRGNGVIDTATLLQRISDEAVARNTRNIHEIELLKTIYELKHTINQ